VDGRKGNLRMRAIKALEPELY